MTRKTLFTLFLFITITLSNFAQVSVSGSHFGLFDDLRKKDYVEIKKRTTVFVINDFDLKQFEQMLNGIWDLNKFIIISPEQFEANKDTYIDEQYSIFKFSGLIRTVTYQNGGSTEYIYLNYNYYYYTDVKTSRKGEKKGDMNEVASVFFAGDADSMWEMIRTAKYGNLEKSLYNYKLGFLKNYLQFINDKLKTGGYSFTYAEDYNKSKIKALQKATLFIPSFIKIKYSGWTGKDTDRDNPDELFKKYDYKYEFIDTDALSDKIMNAKEDFYYLMYTKVNSQKFVSVVNGKTGEIIYRDYEILTYSLKANDLSRLNKKID
jgi:hypothetical protein